MIVPTENISDHRLMHLVQWLCSNECPQDEVVLISSLGSQLRSLPVPADCVALYLRTLHLSFRARIIVWSIGAPIKVYDREHETRHIAASAGSPLREVMETCQWRTIRADSDRDAFDRFEILRDHRMAELLVAPLPNGNGVLGAVTFGTSRAQGFTVGEREIFKRIVPALANTCELRLLRRTVTTLLDTYVGQATGERILAGHIRRGDVESLKAALLLCDLHDFTSLSNRLPAKRVLERLNFYFDQAVPSITANGGEILKFIGDAVLAYFAVDEDPATSCAAAFIAAKTIEARLVEVSKAGDRMSASIALHHGEVSYGNIGSGPRLDFTVIGPDVNLVSRIQGTCSQTGHSVVMSARFNALLGTGGGRSIGWYSVKGFSDPIELFSPVPDRKS
jgi:adenylate cyclase